jgi:hypothetical protein
MVLVEDDADLGAFGGCAAEHRVLHDELAGMLRAAPHRFVEHAVEHDVFVVAHPFGGHGAAAGRQDVGGRWRRGLRRGG